MNNLPIAAGRVVMVDIEGRSLGADTATFLRQHRIRAVCLFRKNLGTEAQIRQLTADLRAAMGEGALIAIDQEGGSVVRAVSLPQAPGAMATTASAGATARRARWPFWPAACCRATSPPGWACGARC